MALRNLVLLAWSRRVAVRNVFGPGPPLAMPAAERSPPPRPLLLLLPSLLLIWCLDGAVGAAAAAAEEEGGGLPSSSSSSPSSSPGDNGLAVADPPAAEATGPGRLVSPSAAMEGKQKKRNELPASRSLLERMETA